MEVIVENWSLISNTYYIKYHYFNMEWKNISSNFRDYLFAHEIHGGSIAVISKNPSNQELMIYTASGILISRKKWDDAPVIGLCWSEKGTENVFLLQKSGNVAIYTLNYSEVRYVRMGDTVKQHSVKSFRFFSTLQGTGLMILTEYNELFYKNNLIYTDSVVNHIIQSKQSLIEPIVDWVAYTDWSCKEIVSLFCLKSGSIVKLINGQDPRIFTKNNELKHLSSNVFKMALNVNSSKLAIGLVDGKICIMSLDSLKLIEECTFDFTVQDKHLFQMEWAGEDLIVLYHEQSLYLMDTTGQSTSCLYLDEPFLFPEIDGVRLITATKHEFIQKIPQELEQLYQFSSESPAIWLFDAQHHLDRQMPEIVKFLEIIQSKEGQMCSAIDTCLKAASNCLEPKWQKTILKAVRLGRSYVPDYKSSEVEEVHRKLLLLNNLKLPFIAMPLTMVQLNKLTMERLIDRLISRHYYPFVERICHRLRLSKDSGINRMLEHWAENFIRRNKDQEQNYLAAKLINRLQDHANFDFAKIASMACDFGLEIVAAKLLDNESRIHQQVRVFLKFKNLNIALERSIESGDIDLISYVVSEIDKKTDTTEFIDIIRNHTIAKTIYLENLFDSTADNKRFLNENEDNAENRAELQLQKILKCESIQLALEAISLSHNSYKKASNEFMIQIMEDEKIMVQTMSTVFKNSEINLSMSVHDFLSYLFEQKLYDKAETLRQKLKISDRQFYWSKLNICAKFEDWAEFDSTIGKWSRKPLVSYYDIGEICAECKNEAQLNKYMDKIEPDKRVRLYVKMDKLAEAEELAKMLKNDYLIHYVAAFKLS